MYVISLVDNKHLGVDQKNKKIWYVHMQGFRNIPVMGSFGGKKHALSVLANRNYMSLSELREYRKKHHLPITE